MNPYVRSVSFLKKWRAHRLVAGAVALSLGALGASAYVLANRAEAPAMEATVAPLPNSAVQPLVAINAATEAIARRVTPSVVEINVEGSQAPDVSEQQQFNQIPEPFRQFFRNGTPPQAQPFKAIGSGVIISPDGYIVTNNHVVQEATDITVTTENQQTYPAKVIGTDPDTDLAVIKVNATNLPSVPWGDSDALQPGETVLAFGNPMGENFTVTRGIVSALDRYRGNPDMRGSFIQTDAPINPGNSGGPLVNVNGEVVGINAEIATQSGYNEGIGFAIPSNIVRPVAGQLMEHGKVVRGYLGVTATNLPPEIASKLDEAGAQGALVSQVSADSPAAKAGLQVYDVITAVNGKPITGSSQLQTVVGADVPGTTVTINFLRDGQPMTRAVTLGTFGADGNETASNGNGGGETGPASYNGPSLGITASPLTSDARQQFHIPDSVQGVLVGQVVPGGPADNAGIQPGDVILQANRQAVTSVDALRSQLETAGTGHDVLLLVWSNGNNVILTAHLVNAGSINYGQLQGGGQ